MNESTKNDLIERILAKLNGADDPSATEGRLRVSDYVEPGRLAAELNTVFANQPLIVAHASSVAAAGDYATATLGHVPVLVTRDRRGRLNAFINACRHRGARLTSDHAGHARVLICPYHGWSYDNDGSLRSIRNPHEFPSVDPEKCALAPLRAYERGGFVWVLPNEVDIDINTWLSGIDTDFDGLGLPDHLVKRRVEQPVHANWKLVMDAFSEGYHLKTLHRNSVRRFFLDSGTIFDRLGPHSRSVGPRVGIEAARETDRSSWDFRAWTTAFYNVFPNTIIVCHPDWVSRITMQPSGTDASTAVHEMLVSKSSERDDEYWERSFALINDDVFAKEDLMICAEIQATAKATIDSHWPLGHGETPVTWFHEELDRVVTRG